MASVRCGSSPKALMIIPGGPGNQAPGGRGMGMMFGTLRPRCLERGYSLWVVTRKRDMPQGHSIADMADDDGALIRDEFDARDILPTISIPVLVIGGDRDAFFPAVITQETARLIPDCTLRLFAGKGHAQTLSDRRLPEDMLHFIARHSTRETEAQASEGASQPVAAMPEPFATSAS